MTDAEQGAALLRTIIDHPADDAARLVYADWLTDNRQAGDPRFLSYPDFIRGYVSWEAAGYAGDHPFARQHHKPNNLMNAPRHWFGLVDRVHPQVPPADMAYVLWRRGFIEAVRCTLDAWLEHAPAIVQAQPIRRVTCSDKTVWEGRDTSDSPVRAWGWWTIPSWPAIMAPAQERSQMPADILNLLDCDPRRLLDLPIAYDGHDGTGGVFFGSEADCLDATSDALLTLARQR